MSPPVLVVGSYPPIPVAGAPVTVREVRRLWAAGEEVYVVSPRLSAAHLSIPVTGPMAGRRLRVARERCGARRLVLVVEPGYPFAGPLSYRLLTAASMARAVKEFDHVRLVVAGPVPLPTAAWARFVAGVAEVDIDQPGPSERGVTPIGPPEHPLSARPRQLAGMAGRFLLGERWPALRRRLLGRTVQR